MFLSVASSVARLQILQRGGIHLLGPGTRMASEFFQGIQSDNLVIATHWDELGHVNAVCYLRSVNMCGRMCGFISRAR